MISKRVRCSLFITAGCALCAAATPAPQTQPAQQPARVAAVPPAATPAAAIPPAALSPTAISSAAIPTAAITPAAAAPAASSSAAIPTPAVSPAAVPPGAVPPAAVPPAPPPPSPSQALRDPTQIDPALAQALTAQGNAPAVQNVVVLITRHGLITMAGKPTVALVEVQGAGSYFVQKGSRLTTSVSGVQATITVDALSADNFQVSVDSKNVSLAIR